MDFSRKKAQIKQKLKFYHKIQMPLFQLTLLRITNEKKHTQKTITYIISTHFSFVASICHLIRKYFHVAFYVPWPRQDVQRENLRFSMREFRRYLSSAQRFCRVTCEISENFTWQTSSLIAIDKATFNEQEKLKQPHLLPFGQTANETVSNRWPNLQIFAFLRFALCN